MLISCEISFYHPHLMLDVAYSRVSLSADKSYLFLLEKTFLTRLNQHFVAAMLRFSQLSSVIWYFLTSVRLTRIYITAKRETIFFVPLSRLPISSSVCLLISWNESKNVGYQVVSVYATAIYSFSRLVNEEITAIQRSLLLYRCNH